MNTEIISNQKDLMEAAALLQAGRLVAVPTETVYGLAGNGLDEKAVEQIYEVKGRPQVKPLSLMVPDAGAMERCCREVPAQAHALAARFWPGPLTIVLRSRELVPAIVRAGGETVGLRCPDHPMTLELLRLAGIPFAAPSANPSGAPSPKTAEEVRTYFDGKIAAIVDGGPCGLGKESTILDMSQKPFRILRQGALPAEEIADALVDAMEIIGVTGPSGSGKSTALQCLWDRGALVLDCDRVYHELLETDPELLSELEARFPGTVENGQLLRKKLGQQVFGDPAALLDLNRITHRHAALDASELLESPLVDRCDFTIGVLASKETRIRRIMARDGISRDYALSRVRAQHGEDYFRSRCTVTVENNDDEATFYANINKVLKEKLRHG